jgi:hypothetical protein
LQAEADEVKEVDSSGNFAFFPMIPSGYYGKIFERSFSVCALCQVTPEGLGIPEICAT